MMGIETKININYDEQISVFGQKSNWYSYD